MVLMGWMSNCEVKSEAVNMKKVRRNSRFNVYLRWLWNEVGNILLSKRGDRRLIHVAVVENILLCGSVPLIQ